VSSWDDDRAGDQARTQEDVDTEAGGKQELEQTQSGSAAEFEGQPAYGADPTGTESDAPSQDAPGERTDHVQPDATQQGYDNPVQTQAEFDAQPTGQPEVPQGQGSSSDYGYDQAHGGAAAAGGFGQSPYGPGSAEAAEDGSGPEGWQVKGNAGSMLFHTPESPSYENSRAEVWFENEEAARAAGFAHWDRKQR
jgi:hypothetical protein